MPPPPPPTDDVILRVQKSLFDALPGLPAERMVDMLEFIATQHSGRNFNPDNTEKALEIAAFCQKSPFAVSKAGVSSLARFARHALGASEGAGNSPEHQLWLLASGALNTAAAICEHGGDVVEFFNSVKRDAGLRGRYLERHFAQAAMRAHLEDPDAFKEAVPPPDLDAILKHRLANLSPYQLFFAGAMLLVAAFAYVIVSSEDAALKLIYTLRS